LVSQANTQALAAHTPCRWLAGSSGQSASEQQDPFGMHADPHFRYPVLHWTEQLPPGPVHVASPFAVPGQSEELQQEPAGMQLAPQSLPPFLHPKTHGPPGRLHTRALLQSASEQQVPAGMQVAPQVW
jgi:hypothetical protein